MGKANKYTVIQDGIAETTILCRTDFKEVAELVANEAIKCQTIFIVDHVSGERERIAQ